MSHRPLPSLPSHLRRRSLSESVELLGLPSSPRSSNTRQSFSDLAKSTPELGSHETVVEFSQGGARSAEYYELHAQREDDKLSHRAAERSAGGADWRNKTQPKRPRPYKGGCIALSLLLTGGGFGWLAGLATGSGPGRTSARGLSLSDVRERVHDMGSGAGGASSRVCNPYSYAGVLNVSAEVASENVWQPVAAPAGCEPVDYMSLIQRAVASGQVADELEFTRGKTIAIVGDSVDREYAHHYCRVSRMRQKLELTVLLVTAT